MLATLCTCLLLIVLCAKDFARRRAHLPEE